MKKILLNSGNYIPNVGFGTFKIPKDLTAKAVKTAITEGYRHIDCAPIYGNEKEVGIGIQLGLTQKALKREDIFVTSKLWNDVRGYDETIDAFNKTLEDLRLDYLDLYLIHWPVPSKYSTNYKLKNAESWRAMEDLLAAGKVRSIGVSNFKINHIKELNETAKINISVNQIEFHPNCTQTKLVDYCLENNIAVEGYATLGQGDVFKSKDLKDMATKYNTSIAKLCAEFSLESRVIPLVKSINKDRIKENLKTGFNLSFTDYNKIKKVDFVKSLTHDSDNIDF